MARLYPEKAYGQFGFRRDAKDFAGIAVYLMSDASAYHTAEKFLIDGGYWVF